jgi:heme oxygenase
MPSQFPKHDKTGGESENRLSSLLREGTSQNHHDAERRPFMRTFFRYELPRDAYIEWISRQWFLYDALETATEELAAHPLVGVMRSPELYRRPGLEADLAFFHGDSWRDEITASPVAEKYADRIRWAAAEEPHRWVAHQWLRYLGMLGGQEILRKICVKSFGLTDEGGGDGMDFYRFPEIPVAGPFFADFHGRMDGMVLDDSQKAEVADEGNTGFQLNMELTDELARDFDIAAPEGPEDAEINALKSES